MAIWLFALFILVKGIFFTNSNTSSNRKKIVLRLNYFKDVCGNPYLTIFSPLLPSITPTPCRSPSLCYAIRLSGREESDLNGVHFSRCGHFQKLMVHSTTRSKFAKKVLNLWGLILLKYFFNTVRSPIEVVDTFISFNSNIFYTFEYFFNLDLDKKRWF